MRLECHDISLKGFVMELLCRGTNCKQAYMTFFLRCLFFVLLSHSLYWKGSLVVYIHSSLHVLIIGAT